MAASAIATGGSASDWGELLAVVLQDVARRCTRGALSSARLVCRHWRSVVDTSVAELHPAVALEAAAVSQLCCRFPALRSLDLAGRGTPRTAGLEAGQLPARLTHLNLARRFRTYWQKAADITFLSGLQQLESLSLRECDKLCEGGVSMVLQLTRLRRLDVSGCALPEDGAQRLAQLTALEDLVLSDARVVHAWGGATGSRLTALVFRIPDSECGIPQAELSAVLPWLAHLPVLERLDLRGVTCTSAAAPPSLHLLRSLGLPYGLTTAAKVSWLDSTPRLTQLHVFGNTWGYSTRDSEELVLALAAMSSLRSLDLSHCPHLTDDMLQPLPGALGALTELRLHSCSQLTHAAVWRVAELPALQVLDIGGCSLLESAAFKRGVARITSLTSLNLSRCSKVADGGLAPCLRALPRLTALDISGCPGLSPALLPALLHLTALRELTWMDCKPHDAPSLCALRALPDLAVLDLQRCRGLSEGLRQQLQRLGLDRLLLGMAH